ncbi:uncharacterized protein DNG_04562 [Cephalotrichum gorgonifer]|uniref:DUF4360 domain-containing protein n=1 Tax=Cephalotrichum gorgonifer TaxID=2041049 RepID=A0AAE8SV13_9PEZI|nr:uncharacterized protein DNG_04562 [Cephalotrichum gorgonifer]
MGQRAPAPDDIPQITINTASTSGSGCPGDSVAVTISPDRTVVTLGFSNLGLAIGEGVPDADAQKTCDIILNIHYPAGYSYAVLETTYHGFAIMDEGVSGNIETEYAFAGEEDEGGGGLLGGLFDLVDGLLSPVAGLLSVVTRVVIPAAGNFRDGDVFTVTDEIPIENVVGSPCEARNTDLLIRITASLESSVANAGGSFIMDDGTFALTQEVQLAWERCG